MHVRFIQGCILYLDGMFEMKMKMRAMNHFGFELETSDASRKSYERVRLHALPYGNFSSAR